MRRNVVLLAVLASFVIGAVAMNAAAGTKRGGATLTQRVTVLEDRADRQAREIDALQTENEKQSNTIQRLLSSRAQTKRALQKLNRLTSRLNGQGVYSGPVDNGQVQMGNDTGGCESLPAQWNATAQSLGC
jgi:hypothetical protein